MVTGAVQWDIHVDGFGAGFGRSAVKPKGGRSPQNDDRSRRSVGHYKRRVA